MGRLRFYLSEEEMRILKFGGSSVSSPERIKNIIKIIQKKHEQSQKLAVVVSAFGGVTDELIRIGHEASGQNIHYQEDLKRLFERHRGAAEALVDKKDYDAVHEKLQEFFNELSQAFQGVYLIKEMSKRSLDFIMSFGERLSAFIISQGLKTVIPSAVFLDAREMIKTNRHFGAAVVDYGQTYDLIPKKMADTGFLPIITGFIGSTDSGETTTLGRGGSDFTASIMGAALNVEEIEIWTDVDGVMTADPRKVEQAFAIPEMSYQEALEMSHFGAKVIHPPTIAPALQRNIPIRIKNTFNSDAEGTLITHKRRKQGGVLCGISSIDSIALLRVEGSGMVGVSGVAARLFNALAKKEINVILISQGSSEHSICFAVIPQSAKQAKEAIEEEFSLERLAGLIDPVVMEKNLSIVAAVGEKMRNTPGVAGRLFGALGRNGINVTAMVQGSSEYNISIVVDKPDETKALNVIHEEFFLSQTSVLNVFLVGTGLIGKTLLEQMIDQNSTLREEYGIEIRLVGLANSQNMCFLESGMEVMNWKEFLAKSPEKMDIDQFIKKMKELNLINCVFVDCTSSEEMANAYQEILEANISIVTPNKKANSGPYAIYKILKDLSCRKKVRFIYETNVGAGLPIISTVVDLLKSGDKILKIEAILSGTLSFLFNTWMKGKKFSEALREAQEKGFTEPDPRDDLNGKDVMRKLLILARESGYPLEIEDISLEPLLPETCYDVKSVAEFYQKLAEYDHAFDQRRTEVQQKGETLHYVATFEDGHASISLKALKSDHPFFHLSGSDNMIAITTKRYENPLVIRGQGAGAEVTAGEVFADIIRIASN